MQAAAGCTRASGKALPERVAVHACCGHDNLRASPRLPWSCRTVIHLSPPLTNPLPFLPWRRRPATSPGPQPRNLYTSTPKVRGKCNPRMLVQNGYASSRIYLPWP